MTSYGKAEWHLTHFPLLPCQLLMVCDDTAHQCVEWRFCSQLLLVPSPADVRIFPHVDGIWDSILPSHLVLRETRGEAYKAKWDPPFWRAGNKGLTGGEGPGGESESGLELPQRWWPCNEIIFHWSFYAISAHRRMLVFLLWRLLMIYEKNI